MAFRHAILFICQYKELCLFCLKNLPHDTNLIQWENVVHERLLLQIFISNTTIISFNNKTLYMRD